MAINRIQSARSNARWSQQALQGPTLAIQPAVKAATVPEGFVVCPTALMSVQGWQQQIYRLAYERAKAAAAIPRHHRVLFSVWN
jgi:hypothetical protein